MTTKDQILKAFNPDYKTQEEKEIDELPNEKKIDTMSNEELDNLINKLNVIL